MTSLLKPLTLAAILLAAILAPAAAQPGAPLTLENAVGLALRANPALRAAAGEVAAQDGALAQAKALPNPELEVLREGQRRESRATTAQLSIPFELGGKRAARVTVVDARDRIGDGPWFNADGQMVAADVESLHTNGLSNGDPQHMMDENGDPIPTNQHDILTGSDSEGRLYIDEEDDAENTCGNWTLSTGEPGPRVGHSDIPANPDFSPSWNNAHTPDGCTPALLTMVGGAGRLYCFAE